jgi:hypothetical protein
MNQSNVLPLHPPSEYDAGHAAALVKTQAFFTAFDNWRRETPVDESRASAKELIEDGRRLQEVLKARIALRTAR